MLEQIKKGASAPFFICGDTGLGVKMHLQTDKESIFLNIKKETTVILTNLGSPSEPTAAGVRKFLAEFLSDSRVVEVPRLLWLCILYGFILPFRPGRVSKLYQRIWTDRGSPLVVYMESLGEKLQRLLRNEYSDMSPSVSVAMTYGKNRLSDVLEEISENNSRRIVILPMYPQYSATTTGAVYDCYSNLIKKTRDIPDCRIIKEYYSEEIYLDAVATSIRQFWHQNGACKRLLFSFHGLPQRNSDLGDPYEQQCRFTAREVASRLGLNETEWGISFQSRLGPAKWLEPATDKLLRQWAENGVKDVDVVCPSFSVDCLETLEEIAITNRGFYQSAGGEGFRYIPCLNDSQAQLDLILALLKKEI